MNNYVKYRAKLELIAYPESISGSGLCENLCPFTTSVIERNDLTANDRLRNGHNIVLWKVTKLSANEILSINYFIFVTGDIDHHRR